MAASRGRLFQFSEKFKFRALLVCLFALGAFLAAFPWDRFLVFPQFPRTVEFTWRILAGVGEAMAIAAVIAAVVDEAAKRKVLKEFAEDISTHIVGRLLPPPLREHIHQYLTVDFVRYNWEITYTLEVLKSNPEFVKLETKSVYEMENRSPFERQYTIAYEVEESWVPQIGSTRITFLKARDLKDQVDLFELGPANPQLKVKNEHGYVKLCLDESMRVHMPAYDPTSQHRCRFEVRSEEYFRNSFLVSFETFHPVLGTTLTVSYPQEKLKTALYLSFGSADAALEDPIDGGKKWTIQQPILPGQGFNVRWDPVAASIQHGPPPKAAQAAGSGTS
jgi:hypothetical protein